MGKQSLRAFISYHDEKPDADVASAIEEIFSARGFEVWSMRQEKSAGRPWMDVYEDELYRSNVFLAVVSPSYLRSKHCQHEVSLASSCRIEQTMLMYPFFITGLDTQFDDDANRALRRLLEMTGYAKYAPPSAADISHAAQVLTPQAINISRTPDDSPADLPPLPLTVRPAATGRDVFIILDEASTAASTIRRVLAEERQARPSGRGRWTVARDLYEQMLAPRLAQAVGAQQQTEGGAVR